MQAENADLAENMDNLTVQNKELGCRAAQLRATASALEAANAAMTSFLATAQAHRANNPTASSFEGSSAAAAVGLSGTDAAAHHAQVSHAIGSEVSALRTQLSALEATRVEVVAQEAANTRAAVIAVQAAAARAACGSSSHATSHDEHDDESHDGLPTPRGKRVNRGGCALAPPLGGAISGMDSQELLTLSKEANTASSREQLDEPSG
ncbi:hypothetical protein DUNSADRAFT_8330 [Dunaliella salina]|uniref:Uncharacterized protein n=1 Tax=Dunaliella salina TaxID=3046 RepID=A0ABQ7H5Y2_DUNSA|nr:hypothetical protein DUNSADRAFT_8330 [Dunaliella salina]|eukprot:KAF5842267.1 hypothetical protein DUNSADRAFT_8330 [Dunaliella salina]